MILSDAQAEIATNGAVRKPNRKLIDDKTKKKIKFNNYGPNDLFNTITSPDKESLDKEEYFL